MIHKKHGVAALLVGLTLVGTGATAYASQTKFELPAAVMSAFTSDQQAAITKAQEIREAADVEAEAVLSDAGVSKDALHDAMDSFREKNRAAMDTALENNDYAAYKELVADMPNTDTLTTDIFAKLVKIHSLEKAGDYEAAQTLREELRDSGYKGGGMMMGKGMGGHGSFGPRTDSDQ